MLTPTAHTLYGQDASERTSLSPHDARFRPLCTDAPRQLNMAGVPFLRVASHHLGRGHVVATSPASASLSHSVTTSPPPFPLRCRYAAFLLRPPAERTVHTLRERFLIVRTLVSGFPDTPTGASFLLG